MSDRPRFSRQMHVLLACSFSVALGYGILSPVLPVLAHSYGVSLSLTGLVVSAFALARLLFATTASKLVSARGEAVVYMSGLLIVAASTFGAAFAPTFWLLVLLRGLGGIGSTMFTIAATGLLIRITPPEIRGRASAAFGGAFLAGSIVGPSLGGLVAELGLRAPFIVYTGTLLVAAALMAGSIRSERRLASAAGEQEKKAPAEALSFREALRELRYKAVVASGFSNGLVVMGLRVAMLPLLAGFVASRPSAGWDPLGALNGTTLTGVAMTAFAVGTLAMLPVSGKLSDTLGRPRPAMMGLAGVAAAFALIGWAPNGLLLVAASLVGGIGQAVYQPAMQATLADVVGSRRGGSAIALPQMATDVGTILGPVLGGAIADAAGFGWGFSLLAAVPALCILLWMRVRAEDRASAAA
ncbi:MFS transporter [Arthrobacter sp. UM1]|uniref:MFS transporter n=1 Tax=Arthrobacter sp. UM1 TaxID=2766776 RepID=UPI001CF62649|nr:MFS transporter [Arthrobacter sp. UM1]MCB4207316.1 MFS transporter [Arthrobacter sp. UM1]